MNSEPSIHTAATVAATAGGFLWALANGLTILIAPNPLKPREAIQALYEGVCSIIAAFIGGYFIAPAVIVYLHIKQIEIVSLISLLIGLILWKITPSLTTGLIGKVLEWLGSRKVA